MFNYLAVARRGRRGWTGHDESIPTAPWPRSGRAGNQLKFIQSRHEEMSALEAVGYAKSSGRPGVCMAASGPGAIHPLEGLYEAKLDPVPVVVIVGQTAQSAIGGSYRQEIDLATLFKDVAGTTCSS
jgi:pyruvate dehydrogenase (quinone)